MRIAFIGYLKILAWILPLAIGFLLLERMRPAVRQSFATTLVNYLYFPFSLAWICFVQALYGPPLSRLLRYSGGGLLPRLVPSRRGVVGEMVLAISFAVAWDVWQYWVHRWQHVSPILWQTHKLHHSDSALSASTQARNHPLNYVYLAACYTPVLFIVGSVTPNIVATVLMFRVWGFVNHANVRVSFGPLTGVIAGPQWHRIHHSSQREHRNRNFAAYFPFIDRLFGTYWQPAVDEYPPTGLAGGEPETFLFESTISPFVWWYRGARRSYQRFQQRRLRDSDSIAA